MTALYFDIETGPLPEEQLLRMMPEFAPPKHPGTFDPATVKVGNLGAEKAAAKIDEARRSHEAAAARYESDVAAAKASHFSEFQSKAALSPLTGRVVAIGLMTPRQDEADIIDCDQDEIDGLIDFWCEVEDALDARMALVGFNICGFDLPFLIRRSWLLGVGVPMGLRKGRYWADPVIDLMDRWGFNRDMVKLDALAKAFGLDGKVSQGEDGTAVSGADFHRLWRENRPLAELYLRQDVRLCYQLGEAMGGV